MYRILALSLLVLFTISCTNNQVEPEIDCDLSEINLSASSTESACDVPSGSITVVVTGGDGPYTFAINAVGVEDNDEGIFENLAAGNYEVTVTDNNSCAKTISTAVTSADGPAIANVATEEAGCGTNQGSLTVTASGGSGDLSYALDGGSSQSSNIFNGLSSGSYELIVADESGCETVTQVDVLSGVSLTDDITPIITANCYGSNCHNSGRSPDFTSSAGIIGSASRILARTSATTNQMPPSGRLSDDLINEIECWVSDGAPEN